MDLILQGGEGKISDPVYEESLHEYAEHIVSTAYTRQQIPKVKINVSAYPINTPSKRK